jgi:hypothetical protein
MMLLNFNIFFCFLLIAFRQKPGQLLPDYRCHPTAVIRIHQVTENISYFPLRALELYNRVSYASLDKVLLSNLTSVDESIM